ncbi:MAG: efflux RND transporter permease subunit, partial [Gemmatimonadota bacterium]
MGIAGRMAQAFLHSKLTPLITIASLGVGVLAIVATPREEEPQISVPMIDVIAAMPGASPEEVENLLTRPIEKLMWQVPGVEYLYSMASDGMTVVTVRFKVGTNQDLAVSRVFSKMGSAADQAPPGAMPPLIKPHSIDDVPILALTLHGGGYGSDQLRAMATHLADELSTIPDLARIDLIGGEPTQLRVTLDPARLAGSGVTPGEVMQALGAANVRLPAGEYSSANQVVLVSVGAPIRTARDAGDVVVANRGGPVYLRDVATVTEAPGEVTDYVTHASRGQAGEQAVTIAVAKRPGVNATDIADAALRRLAEARSRLLPADVQVDVTRNYGETASEKSNELMLHLLIATLSVTVLIGIFLGWREALVVLVAVPVTLALTLFVYYAMGYSLNRITLFALIFSIGILVDDAIVVVENIYRHLQMGDRPPDVAAVEGVDEVGNPTILATFAVIAAILPMAFVSGLMGPYMRPIPVGASAAMLASLAVAFIITPYLALRLLRGHVAASAPMPGQAHEPEALSGFAKFYSGIMSPLMDRPRRRMAFYGGIGVLLLLSMGLLAVKLVQVKML